MVTSPVCGENAGVETRAAAMGERRARGAAGSRRRRGARRARKGARRRGRARPRRRRGAADARGDARGDAAGRALALEKGGSRARASADRRRADDAATPRGERTARARGGVSKARAAAAADGTSSADAVGAFDRPAVSRRPPPAAAAAPSSRRGGRCGLAPRTFLWWARIVTMSSSLSAMAPTACGDASAAQRRGGAGAARAGGSGARAGPSEKGEKAAHLAEERARLGGVRRTSPVSFTVSRARRDVSGRPVARGEVQRSGDEGNRPLVKEMSFRRALLLIPLRLGWNCALAVHDVEVGVIHRVALEPSRAGNRRRPGTGRDGRGRQREEIASTPRPGAGRDSDAARLAATPRRTSPQKPRGDAASRRSGGSPR